MRIVYWGRLRLARELIIERLQAVPGAELVVVDSLEEVLQALPGAAGLETYDAPTAEARAVVETLNAPQNTVRWMHFLSAGREGFEAAGLPRGLRITYAAGAVAPAVAEHAMAMLLALGRRLPEAYAAMAGASWDRSMAARASSLEGGVMAIVGLGHIGREVAKRARGFDMELVAVTRTIAPSPLVDEVRPLADLDQVLPRADAIVMAIALSPDTRHLIGRAALALCKPSAFLINVGRGGLVDPVALREALVGRQIAGAGLDVTEPEPLPDGDPLWTAPNLVISCHYAGGGSRRSHQRLAGGAADNLARLIAGEPLLHEVTA
jgi:phosphoglycerate dehydrogenase-like enzyme